MKAKKSKKQELEAAVHGGSGRVAAWLLKNYPHDAMKIATGMSSVAKNKNWERKLSRVKLAISASASAAA